MTWFGHNLARPSPPGHHPAQRWLVQHRLRRRTRPRPARRSAAHCPHPQQPVLTYEGDLMRREIAVMQLVQAQADVPIASLFVQLTNDRWAITGLTDWERALWGGVTPILSGHVPPGR